MLLIEDQKKSYMGSPMASSGLTFSALEGKVKVTQMLHVGIS